MRQRSIIQISAYYPPHVGGQEYAVSDLAQALLKRGHAVTVLTSDQASQAGESVEKGIKVKRLHSAVFGQAPIMPAFVWRLWRLLDQPSVVHLHVGQAFTPEMTWLVCWLRRRPYLMEIHIELTASGPAGWLLPIYKRLVLGPVIRRAAAVLVLNDQNQTLAKQYYGYGGPIYKVSNGIPEDYFGLRRRPPHSPTLHLLFVGRLTPQKNLLNIVKAISQLTRPVQVDIVGDGEQRQILADLVSRLGLEKQIKLHGQLDRDQILDYYAGCHALLLPSLNEAQPLALLEAMAARVPIIGSDVRGVSEHIQGVGIIGGTSPEAIAASIMEFAATMDKLGPQIERGFEYATQRRLTNLITEYEKIYDAVYAES